MLDENLPTFIFRPMPDHPSSAVVYFTRSGSEPAPEYIFRLADPVSKPECRGVYAAALTDPYHSNDVVYGEVAVEPEWQQPTLSAAELRAERERGHDGGGAPHTPRTPDAFTIQLYNPDQTVTVRWTPKTWNRSESWEFELPIETFRLPSASQIDTSDTLGDALRVCPKNGFRWKRDGRLGNKDMTCFLLGRTVDYHAATDKQSVSNRRKEPDITVALVKHARDPAVTIYEPNLQRVDVQDRKGLELVLLLGAQVIRDLYVVPRADPYNMEGAAAGAARRKNTRTSTMATAGPAANSTSPGAPLRRPSSVYMSGALSGASGAPGTSGAPLQAPGSVPSAAAIEAETRRLQTMLEAEERERQAREQEEERRIKAMLEAEAEEQRRVREEEIARETERLRQLYGTDGQELPSAVPPPPGPPPGPPPSVASSSNRPVPPPPTSSNRPAPPPPPPSNNRPVSANVYASHPSQPQSHPYPSHATHGKGRKSSGGFLSNPAASMSGFFSSSSSSSNNRHRSSSGDGALGVDERMRLQKKRSVHF